MEPGRGCRNAGGSRGDAIPQALVVNYLGGLTSCSSLPRYGDTLAAHLCPRGWGWRGGLALGPP